MVEIKLTELKPRRLRAELTGLLPSEVNAIRRTLLSDVPKLAIEDVEFHLGPIRDEATGKDYDSSTSMFDEAVAMRMGLLPIPTDLGQFRRKSECTCKGEGCPHCQVMFSVDKKGPCTVYARDVIPLGDATLAILEPDVPIVRLGARQALLAYATAIVGSGREHAKWQVAHAAGMSPRAEIKIQKKAGCSDTCLKRMADASPSGLLTFKGGKLEYTGESDPENAVRLIASQKLCEHGSLQVKLADDDFFLRFDTDGSLTARETFRYAVKDLKRRYEELREQVQAIA
ncbi:MAG: DNA-directed RNA polymerase subunit D [Thermoplasmata archaeon]|nr:DNA-directed RNA polymerase subunit D [Thermoplasmata archaeon]